MTKSQKLNEKLQLIIQKGNRSLAAARKHIVEGDYDFASSRAYYAVFYAMEAVLLTKNLSASKHAGVTRLFNQHFVKTAIFPAEFGKFIGWLFSDRQTGDYKLGLSIDQTNAERNVQLAETILQAITEYLTREGFLEEN